MPYIYLASSNVFLVVALAAHNTKTETIED